MAKEGQKDKEIEQLREYLEKYKQEKEETDITIVKKLQEQEKEHQIYIKNLQQEIK